MTDFSRYLLDQRIEEVESNPEKLKEYVNFWKEYDSLTAQIKEKFAELGKIFYKARKGEEELSEDKVTQLEKEVELLTLKKDEIWEKICNHDFYGIEDEDYFAEYFYES